MANSSFENFVVISNSNHITLWPDVEQVVPVVVGQSVYFSDSEWPQSTDSWKCDSSHSGWEHNEREKTN